MLRVVILMGLPASGKTTFCNARFSLTHVVVNDDCLRESRRPGHRQGQLTEALLGGGCSVVVDRPNLSFAEREHLIRAGRAQDAQIVGYFLDTTVEVCRARNAQRPSQRRHPEWLLWVAAQRLQEPYLGEGFDHLFRVRAGLRGTFSVSSWDSLRGAPLHLPGEAGL